MIDKLISKCFRAIDFYEIGLCPVEFSRLRQRRCATFLGMASSYSAIMGCHGHHHHWKCIGKDRSTQNYFKKSLRTWNIDPRLRFDFWVALNFGVTLRVSYAESLNLIEWMGRIQLIASTVLVPLKVWVAWMYGSNWMFRWVTLNLHTQSPARTDCLDSNAIIVCYGSHWLFRFNLRHGSKSKMGRNITLSHKENLDYKSHGSHFDPVSDMRQGL